MANTKGCELNEPTTVGSSGLLAQSDLFWEWFRVSHPHDWWKGELGSPAGTALRLAATELARSAFIAGYNSQNDRTERLEAEHGK